MFLMFYKQPAQLFNIYIKKLKCQLLFSTNTCIKLSRRHDV